MDNLTLLRKRIGDNIKTQLETFDITPNTTSVELSFDNPTITKVSYTSHSQTTEISVYTLTDKLLSFTAIPDSHTVLEVVYQYSAFSNDELNTILASRGVNGAVVEALTWLLADSARLYSYSRGATNEQLDQIFNHLKQLLDRAEKQGNLDDPNNDGSSSGFTIAKRISNHKLEPAQTKYNDISRLL